MKVIVWHYRAALMGFLFILPFVITSVIMGFGIEPFYSLLNVFPIIRSSPVFPLLLLLFLHVGAIVSIHPMLFKAKDGMRKIPILNSILSAMLFAIFLFLFIPLAKDVYKCQILEIPNCD